MAVVSSARPDDASGDAFRDTLVYIREIRPRQDRPARRAAETQIVWEHEIMPPDCPAVREATAVIGDYFLYAVEMRDSFLQRQDIRMPKINWALGQPGDDGEALAGTAAPTFEEAMARAEAAMRVFLGQALDS